MAELAKQGGMSRWGDSPPASPFALMRRMSEEMDRFFSEAGHRWFGQGQGESWYPAVEVAQKDNTLTVCADLPGMKPEEVKIEVTDDALVLQGERRQESEKRDEGYFHTERSYGRFFRRIPLPQGAQTDKARAQFKNGELRVTIPVEEEQTRRRQIPIEAGR